MTAIAWDQIGERIFQTGVDRGVLYMNDGRSVPWNGLISVEDGSDREVTPFYLDGVRYLTKITPGEFSGKLKAFTYPEEFDEVTAVVSDVPGLLYYDQPPQDFSLSYRTHIGNDVEGVDYGYKIHIFYNLVADGDASVYETFQDPLKPVEFAWAIQGTPPPLQGHRPTVHIAIDSTTCDPDVLNGIEDILYGTADTPPRLPPIDELENLFKALGALVIVDNGDGTWTAIDLGDDYITMNSATQFTITGADATYLDASTYTISTTYP